MKKFKIIEQVLSNLAKEYVNNNKSSKDFVEEADSDIAAMCSVLGQYNDKGAAILFDTNEGLRVYRNKQKQIWELIKKIRAGV